MKKFLLLQINDALFPVGGYFHSYGLETYIQKNLVFDQKSALDYVEKYIKHNLLHGDLLGAKLAWEICDGSTARFWKETKEQREMQNPPEVQEWRKIQDSREIQAPQELQAQQVLWELKQLDQMATASRIPLELRQASEKIASRFLKTLINLNVEYEIPWFEQYALAKEKDWKKNYATAYGVFCASVGLELEESLTHLLYAQTSALVTNCVKTIPLSQTAGQQILYQCIQRFDSIIEEVKRMCIDDYAVSLPGADIRSMQHESLYSRLYMS